MSTEPPFTPPPFTPPPYIPGGEIPGGPPPFYNPPPAPARRLTRSSHNRVISGVAGGLGEYFGIDPVMVRVGLVLLALFGGGGVALYAVAWLLIPEEGEPESIAAGMFHHDGRSVQVSVPLLVVGLAVLFFSGMFRPWAMAGVVWPLALIALGVAFYASRR